MVRTGYLAALSATLLVSSAAIATAQPDPGVGGSEVELDEDPAPATGDETGGEEDPDAPLIGDAPAATGPTAPAQKKTGYPIAEVERPITLPDFTSEVRLDLRLFPDPLDAEFGLRARYGITRQAQIGVRYSIGGFYEDGKPNAGDDKATFNTGKSVALEFQFLVQDWIAPRVTVPMYVDPFAIGMTLGGQMKFKILDKLALVGFEDVVGFRLNEKFLPDLDSERYNEGAADAVAINEITSKGFLRFDGGVVYQAKPNLAVGGRFGVTFNDFSDNDAATSLRLQVQHTPKSMIDVIGQLGWLALDDNNTFHIGAALAVRI
ncbi:MAG: hypothetical protein K8M05_17085 [Deltaproteobacteria bacterium]|nr:hypothetical protein [Kofleriaceae bacterium]